MCYSVVQVPLWCLPWVWQKIILTGEEPEKLLYYIWLDCRINIRTLKYGKTKTTLPYCKHRVLGIPDLFKLSVAKLMYSFDIGELPKHFDNYFSDIASLRKYQTKLALCAKILLTHNGNVSLSAYSMSVQKFGLIFLKIWNLPRFNHLENNRKTSLYLFNITGDFRFICLSLFYNVVFSAPYPLFPSVFLPLRLLTKPLVNKWAFPLRFVLLFFAYFIWIWFVAFW